MRKWMITLSICSILLCSIPSITAEDTGPSVLLPSAYVTMQAADGTESWFDITISNITHDYYDIKNGTYPGWCVQKSMDMAPNVSGHQVMLISSYDTDLNGFEGLPWNKINYIINHKNGANRDSIQWAIWHYTDDKNVSDLPVSKALVDAADQNGSDYIPQSGDILAIPMIGSKTIQLAFLELEVPEPSLQGRVWYDTNSDGIQNQNEQTKLAGVTVRLYNSTDALIDETQTTTEGIYTFGTVQPGSYYIQFIRPSEYVFTKKDVGGNTNESDTTDSDADTSNGKTILFTITGEETESITIWDAGMYIPSSEGEPEPPEPEPEENIRPTADCGNFGNSYHGFVNATITFNGSRSYDQDGRIISYRWAFGDGTEEGTGVITTHVYTSPGTYNVSLLVRDDGSKTGQDTTTAIITLGNNKPGAPVITGPHSGTAIQEYTYTFLAIDPDADTVKYYIDWGDDTQYSSSFLASGASFEQSHQWTYPGFYIIQAYVQDTYDEISSITQMKIEIDVIYVADRGYLIDMTGDGIYEKFYSNITETETKINHKTDGLYLIDTDGDGQYDLEYNPASGQTQHYQEQPLLLYGIVGLIALILVMLILFFFIRRRGQSRTLNKNQEPENKK